MLLRDVMPIQAGDHFGRYRIIAELGRGGMGVVWHARDTLLARNVALKLVVAGSSSHSASLSATGSGSASATLLREARAAASINHSNAVSVFDVGEVDGVPYIAMELIEGKTLRHFIARESCELQARVSWLWCIARALAAAHAQGLVHRDVKPENVMIRADGTAKMLDFGICRPVATEALAFPSGKPTSGLDTRGPTGTPRYMSPEQLRGEPADARADQFSWGVLAYELLCGSLPWASHTQSVDALLRARSRAPYALREWNPEIDPELDAVVRRALALRPEDRFASMDALAAALQPLRAAPEPVRPNAASAVRRPEALGLAPRVSASGGPLALAAVVVGLSAAALLGRAAPDRPVAVPRALASELSAGALPAPSAAAACSAERIGESAFIPRDAAAGHAGAAKRALHRRPKRLEQRAAPAPSAAAMPSDPLADPN